MTVGGEAGAGKAKGIPQMLGTVSKGNAKAKRREQMLRGGPGAKPNLVHWRGCNFFCGLPVGDGELISSHAWQTGKGDAMC